MTCVWVMGTKTYFLDVTTLFGIIWLSISFDSQQNLNFYKQFFKVEKLDKCRQGHRQTANMKASKITHGYLKGAAMIK